MNNIQLDYSDIMGIFREKLKIDNVVKKISSIFLNERYRSKIDYKPYFQRNYVWDDEKSSYFIESILLGTEIPPMVFFQSADKIEVIDGRQRYETIKRFLDDKLILKEQGLHSLKSLAYKRYSQLSDETKELFESTRIRIIQFSVVDEPHLDMDQEDRIKKEIFRRYNSGITPLKDYDIDRAAYIKDGITNRLQKLIIENDELYEFLCEIFLPKSKKTANKRDKVNILVSRIRNMITLPYVPIYKYSHGSSKAAIIGKFYNYYVASDKDENSMETIASFIKIVNMMKILREKCDVEYLKTNILFYETFFWGFSIVSKEGCEIHESDIDGLMGFINNINGYPELWNNIIKTSFGEVVRLFESAGSHYYSAINNRYNFVANLCKKQFGTDFHPYLKGYDDFNRIMEKNYESEEIKHYTISKALPETLTIEDILSDMKKSRFLIRPDYQRSEVKNIAKASYLMESILLGIKIPPIFVYKRTDKVKEVVDGQQRLLTIIGFLGRTYIDDNGNRVGSDKDRFKLGSLKIMPELNGKNIDSIDEEYENRILDFPIDVIEIDCVQNPDFSQIDLFLRLNTKPYPIQENTFEMWNAYVDKRIIQKAKELAEEYEGRVFKSNDLRMKVEELITSLAYLDYKITNEKKSITSILNVYIKNGRMCARISKKGNVTRTLSEISNNNPNEFIASLNHIDLFAKKVLLIIDNDESQLRTLFRHTGKGSIYKTDQNFYFLWLMLRNLSMGYIKNNRQQVFAIVSDLFERIQKSKTGDTVDNFYEKISEISDTMFENRN